ncbi:MAG: hypothetical protein AABW59_02890 [archaeon]
MPITTTLTKVKGKFSLKSKPFWNYKDRRPLVFNAIEPFKQNIPHLILCDAKGVPRFTLGYTIHGNDMVIGSIQRTRTKYKFSPDFHTGELRPSLFKWDPAKETHSSKLFQDKLGKHPAEFLLSQFILQNKEAILAGGKVKLAPQAGSQESWNRYMALVDRFFVYSPQKGFELSLKKKRVKELLGLK